MALTGPYMGPSLNVCPYFYRQLKKKKSVVYQKPFFDTFPSQFITLLSNFITYNWKMRNLNPVNVS